MKEHWLLPILKQMEDQKFYGAVTLKFRNGKIVLVEEQRTILPPEEEKNSIRETVSA